jgi:hypothetical protein
MGKELKKESRKELRKELRKEFSPPNMVSTAKVPLNLHDRVKMELHWSDLVNRHKFAVQQIEGLHPIDAWEVYFNALEKWREAYMDQPVHGTKYNKVS